MKKTFIEAAGFSARLATFLTEEDYRELQTLLMEDPDRGKVMSGCGGARKMRFHDKRRHKGKRGGIRVIYLHVPEHDRVFLMKIYDKHECDELTPQQKKVLRALAEEFKKAVI